MHDQVVARYVSPARCVRRRAGRGPKYGRDTCRSRSAWPGRCRGSRRCRAGTPSTPPHTGTRIVAGAEHPLERLARVGVVRRLQVHVVVARAAVPGQPDRADDAVQPVVIRQVVEHQVAVGDPERRIDAGRGHHHVVADVAHLRQALRLRIGEQQRVERGRLILPPQREVDRVGQRPGRRQPREAERQLRRAALWRVHMGEPRDLGVRIHRGHVAGGLDDEHGLAGRHRQAPASVGIGLHHLPPVRHHHAGEALPRAAGRDLVHRAACGIRRRLRRGLHSTRQGQPRRPGEGLPPRHIHHHAPSGTRGLVVARGLAWGDTVMAVGPRPIAPAAAGRWSAATRPAARPAAPPARPRPALRFPTRPRR